MNSIERRKTLLNYLKQSEDPITGSQLSKIFDVTRQIIVADIALLRAKGEDIIGTPRGYIYASEQSEKIRQKIASIHSRDPEEIREELYLIVDNGASIRDVIVEHPLYGEITASLHISSRHDVEQFIKKLAKSKAEPLLVLTEGLHLHTLVADNPKVLIRVKQRLADKGYLAAE